MLSIQPLLSSQEFFPFKIQTKGIMGNQVNNRFLLFRLMKRHGSSIEKFKLSIKKEGHYSLAYINFLADLIEQKKSISTYQQIYELIDENSKMIVRHFETHQSELELIENKNPLCFDSIKQYFLHILRVVHNKYAKDIPKFMEGLRHTLKDFKTILENSPSNIAKNAEILLNEPGQKRIMVYSYSKSIALSLKNLASRLEGSLSVYICKGGQLEEGERMFKELTVLGSGAHFQLISDNEISCYLDKIDIVLIGAEVVLKNGAILNRAGTYCLALAAHEAGKKLYVFAESYKYLKRIYLTSKDIPQLIVKSKEGNEVAMDDLTPAKYVSLFFTDIGIFTPEVVSFELSELLQ